MQQRFRRLARRMAVTMLFGVLCTATTTFVDRPARAEFPTGKLAPGFSLKQLNGKPLPLASLKGKVVLLDFWGPT